MIDRITIDKIRSAANIYDIVKEFVTLKKAGANYKGLCPFHDEKTPSFIVSPSKQLFKCFSCGEGGDAVGFIMKHEQMTYPEALKWIAKRYGIEVREKEETEEEKKESSEREAMFAANQWARDYFTDTLYNNVEGVAIGMAYFRARGFRDDIIKKFQLGFCLPERDAMAQAALKRGYAEEYLVKTGLCVKTEDGKLLDRYHGRVIFPVHTISGRVVAFGGRVLNTEKQKNVGKYVNSPESSIYNKSHELYGLYLAKHAITKHDRCFLVEGYTDVISMHQAGIENVVSSSGTSLTIGQIRLLRRFTHNIT
ncbi:MAG: DNA primase, partial [Prevotellamassilia sp.]|nr:DNA primase [Prevotellamassilia sp.]